MECLVCARWNRFVPQNPHAQPRECMQPQHQAHRSMHARMWSAVLLLMCALGWPRFFHLRVWRRTGHMYISCVQCVGGCSHLAYAEAVLSTAQRVWTFIASPSRGLRRLLLMVVCASRNKPRWHTDMRPSGSADSTSPLKTYEDRRCHPCNLE